MEHTLIVITGPTGAGKTDLAIATALQLGAEIISADSRQMFRHIAIGTAAPDASQLAAVPHHFVQFLELDAYYSAATFEQDVLQLLPQLWQKSPYAIMCGGSMMYIDAVCNGIDVLPTVSVDVRRRAYALHEQGGLPALLKELEIVDPQYLATAPDLKNHKRLIHALEVSWQAGKPYSSMLTGRKVSRPFRIVKCAVVPEREVLFDRINRRVEAMVQAGLEQEAAAVAHLRHLNSLNTVGYKEMFDYFDGKMTRDEAVARIGKNTRVYAKKQLTWLKKDPTVNTVSTPGDILSLLGKQQ